MLAEMESISSEDKRNIIKEAIKFISELTPEIPPVEAGRRLSDKIIELTGIKDPFKNRKRLFNEKALEIVPEARSLIKNSPDPLESSIRFSLIANLIDFGALTPDTEDIGKILQSYNLPLGIDELSRLREHIKRASSIVILGDNAGEIVFDRLFIEQLPQDKKVTYVVRGKPILNDVTMEDAIYVGMDKVCNIESTGDNLPGVFFKSLPERLKALICNADLIISKGQGNFESFEPECPTTICYLLVAKCKLVASILGVPQKSMVILCKERGEGK